MTNYKATNLCLNDVILFESREFTDHRGSFYEIYNKFNFEQMGVNDIFVQENITISKKNVLRGIHYNKKYPQSKLIRVIKGKIFDVIIDMREDSSTYLKLITIELSSEKRNILYIPKGFAHGYLSLECDTIVSFMVSDYWHEGDEETIIWNDKFFDIQWPVHENELIIAEKDINVKCWKRSTN